MALASLAWGLLGLLGAVLLWLGIRPIYRWKLRRMPGPSSPPFIGNLPGIVKLGWHEFARQMATRYGPMVCTWSGSEPWIIISDPDLARKVYSKFMKRRGFPAVLRGQDEEVDRKGLVWAKDLHWRLARRAWEPAVLYPDSLKGYLPGMQASARRLMKSLAAGAAATAAAGGAAAAAAPPAAEVDIWRELGRMTLDVVGSAAFGVDLNTMGPEPASTEAEAAAEAAAPAAAPAAAREATGVDGAALQAACESVFQAARLDKASGWTALLVMLPTLERVICRLAYLLPDRKLSKNLAARRVLAAQAQQLIDGWKAARQGSQGAAAGDGRKGRGPVAPGSFLGLVLEARDTESGQKLSDLQVVSQAFTFLLAGYETTANALTFAIYLVASHPAAERKLLAEVDALVASKAGTGLPDLVPEDLERLPFTGAVLSEAMRLFPPAGITGRLAEQDLELGGFAIPRGCNLVLPIYSLHRDPAIWPEPSAFRPERFLPGGEALAARSAHAYIPFGGGPRMCVGYRFAQQEAKLALAQLYSRMTFRLVSGQEPLQTAHGITLGPKHGLKVTVHLRQ